MRKIREVVEINNAITNGEKSSRGHIFICHQFVLGDLGFVVLDG